MYGSGDIWKLSVTCDMLTHIMLNFIDFTTDLAHFNPSFSQAGIIYAQCFMIYVCVTNTKHVL